MAETESFVDSGGGGVEEACFAVRDAQSRLELGGSVERSSVAKRGIPGGIGRDVRRIERTTSAKIGTSDAPMVPAQAGCPLPPQYPLFSASVSPSSDLSPANQLLGSRGGERGGGTQGGRSGTRDGEQEQEGTSKDTDTQTQSWEYRRSILPATADIGDRGLPPTPTW